jgi:hypothetical protein
MKKTPKDLPVLEKKNTSDTELPTHRTLKKWEQ